MPKSEVTCNHCNRPIPYGEPYLVLTWMYMNEQDLEEHDERVSEFCKECSTFLLQLSNDLTT